MNATTMTIVGNLTDAPDLRYLPSGAPMCKFTVAQTPRLLDKTSGEWRDGEPLFMNCTAWRDLAEHAAESLAKGARVIVTGRLTQSRWETEAGEKRSAYGLDVEDLGASLRFATAKVQKLTRTRGGDAPPDDDAWTSASRHRPPVTAPADGDFNEPPF